MAKLQKINSLEKWRSAVRILGTRGFYWVLGKYAELRGDTFSVAGYRFTLKGLSMATGRKGRQFFHYEAHERQAIQQYLDRSLPVIELGGGLGVVACITNMRLEHPEKHVVVEANPELIPVIETNRQRHACQFELIQAAVGYGGSTVTFYRAEGRRASSTRRTTGEAVEVATISLRQILDRYGFEQVALICDIEGTEMDLVQQEADVLARHVQLLIVEFHPNQIGENAVENIRQQLAAAGFTPIEDMPPNKVGIQVSVFRNTKERPLQG